MPFTALSNVIVRFSGTFSLKTDLVRSRTHVPRIASPACANRGVAVAKADASTAMANVKRYERLNTMPPIQQRRRVRRTGLPLVRLLSGRQNLLEHGNVI